MNRYNEVHNSVDQDVDSGLRSYMISIYNYMAIGLIITALCSYLTATSPYLMNLVYGTPLKWVVMFAPLAFILVLSFGINKLSVLNAQLLFWLFSAVMGVSIAYIFVLYTGVSIARVFVITSATFLTMSIYGYTTKTDLSRFGSILTMALIGLIIASVVNIFLKSSGLEWGISLLGVIIFTGLVAYDTQRIKAFYYEASNEEEVKKKAIFGALMLYLDFVNLFLMLLRLIGDRRG